MKKLAIVSTHPIQYHAPIFKLLATAIDVRVFYTEGDNSLKKFDPGFGKEIQWDIPLLEGYNYKFLLNNSKNPGSHSFWGIRNPYIISEINAFNPDALLVYGWAYHSHLKIIRHFKGKIPVWFRGDSIIKNDSGLRGRLKNIFLRQVYSYIDKAFYVGSENKKYFIKYGLKESQLIFAPHAVDNVRFAADRKAEAEKLKNSLGITPDAIVILFAGKLDYNKNPLKLLNAFKTIKDEDVHLIIAGDGELKKQLIIEGSSYKNVHFPGFFNQSPMPVLYQSCDLFCLPSDNETWGLAVNEAMAAGKAILVSNGTGCAADLVQNYINGLIFNVKEECALENALNELISDKMRLHRMGQSSSEIIKAYEYRHQIEAFQQQLFHG